MCQDKQFSVFWDSLQHAASAGPLGNPPASPRSSPCGHAGGHGKTDIDHLGQVGAFAPEEGFLGTVTIGFPAAEEIDVLVLFTGSRSAASRGFLACGSLVTGSFLFGHEFGALWLILGADSFPGILREKLSFQRKGSPLYPGV